MLKVLSLLFQCLAILKGIFGNCVKPVRIFRWWQAPHLEIPESQVLLKLPSAVTVAGWWSHDFAQVTQPMNDDTHDISWYLMSLFPHAVCSYSRAWLHSNWHTSHTLTSWAGFPTLQVNLSLRWEIWSILEEGAAARFTTAWRQAVTSLNLSQALRLLCTSRKSWKTCQKETQAILRQFSPERQSNFLWSFIEVITMKWFVVFCINPCSAARKPPRRLNCFASESFVESLMISNGFSSFIAQDSVVSTGDVFLRPIFFAFRPASVMRSASAQIVGSQTSQTAESGEFGPILELTQVYQIFPNRKNRKNISSWVCLCVGCPVTLLTLAPFQRLTTISSSKRRVWFLELSHTIEIYWVTVAFLIHMTNLNCFPWVLHEARRFRAFLLRLGSRKQVPRCPQTAFCIGFNWLILKWLQNTLPVIMGGASRNGSVGGSSVFSSDEKFLKRVRLQMNEKPKKLKPFGIKHVPSVSGNFQSARLVLLQVQGYGALQVCHGQFWNTWKGIEGGQYSCVHIKKDYRSIVAKHAQTSENSWNSWLWSIIIYLGFVL